MREAMALWAALGRRVLAPPVRLTEAALVKLTEAALVRQLEAVKLAEAVL
jgi:hypothetical protein